MAGWGERGGLKPFFGLEGEGGAKGAPSRLTADRFVYLAGSPGFADLT